MSRLRNDNRILIVLTLAVAALLLSVVGCERKIVGDVQVDETVSDQCFNCHNGQLDAMQGEWANSIHASGANVDYTSRPGNDCVRCHNQEGFLTWIATGTLAPSTGNSKAIGCFACHNPHEYGDLRLRVTAPTNMVTGAVYDVGVSNICAQCHQSRTNPAVITDPYTIASNATRFGPHHGPQGDLLIGTAGYEGFSGFTPEFTLHKDVLKNPFDATEDGGCTGCHMNYANTHEGYNVGGHSWNMKDEDGNSLAATCRTSGCHDAGALAFTNSVSGEPFDFTLTSGASVDWDNDGTVEGYQTEMEGMLDSLHTLLDLQNILNPANGLAVPGTYAADLMGAFWNYKLIEEDRSLGIHNWEYNKSLIEASIAYVSGLPIP